MSDDPETLRQIRELSLDDRALLVVDVDDVVLEFLRPFMRYLDGHDLQLALNSFRLYGNILHRETREAADEDTVRTMIGSFFEAQGDWQTLTDGASAALEHIAAQAEIVLLTAMPHRFRAQRQALLERLELPYPLVTTEAPKGPALKALRGESRRPVAFVDDFPSNHHSVRDSVPDATLFHLMAMPEVGHLLPPLPDGVIAVAGWTDALPRIVEALQLDS